MADTGRIELACLGRIESAGRVQDLVFLRPDRRDLRELLLEGHAREQVVDAPIDWRCGVLVERA